MAARNRNNENNSNNNIGFRCVSHISGGWPAMLRVARRLNACRVDASRGKWVLLEWTREMARPVPGLSEANGVWQGEYRTVLPPVVGVVLPR